MKVGLLGHGVVGSGVRKIIDANKTNDTKQIEIVKILVKENSEITDERMTTDASSILCDPEIDVVVECMGGIEPAHAYAMEAMKHGKHFVTSNKKMFATCIHDLHACAIENSVSLHYEASCGGGIPWMANLERCKRIDEMNAFRGIFNGTTNYILNRMFLEKKNFDEMLKEAQKLGYAEKDPTDDIDGYDVRFKVALSCLKAFGAYVKPEEIPMFGIRYVDSCDLDYCREHGYVLKMIGKGTVLETGIQASVMPTFLKQEDVFSSIPLNFNAIESDSPTLGKAVYIGQGAGSLPTAHAVVQDIIDILHAESMELNMKETSINNDHVKGVYYIHTTEESVFEDVIDEKMQTAFITKEITLNELLRRLALLNDPTVFVAEVEK